eukprot:jgi/Chlat1/7611/Chrsp64S07096
MSAAAAVSAHLGVRRDQAKCQSSRDLRPAPATAACVYSGDAPHQRMLVNTEARLLSHSRVFSGDRNRQAHHTPKRHVAHVRCMASASSSLQEAEVQQKQLHEEEGLGVVAVDPQLAPHADHFRYRWQAYTRAKREIEEHEGGLEHFSRGYEKFGFHRESGGITYREWAPAAQSASLIGDFNGWDPNATQLSRDAFGVWSTRLEDRNGAMAIPHGSRVKVRLQRPDGGYVDRVPAWIKRAAAEPGVMGALYDGIFWQPPEHEKYEFKHERPGKPGALRVYESHVGMSSPEPRVATYREFARDVLPRVKRLGYNAIQLMAVMEHSYYASFGYHVTSPFAISSRSGTPEDLKFLVDEAHRLGIMVLMDVVHSHASNNANDGLNGFDFGQGEEASYFRQGAAGYHTLWDSRIYNYGNWEVKRYLLSNLRWYMEEYKFDGFRFDGVTSMLYHHHGINMGFSGGYHEYFGVATDVDAIVYLMLANDMLHSLYPNALTVAEDVSGMPALCRPVREGGVGFDYRLAMATPDKWIQLLKHRKDEEWSMHEIIATLCNRRYTEKCVAYSESHDQGLVGDKTIAFWLMDQEMYFGMSALSPPSVIVERGIALHKMIRLITMALGGEGYLNFMGNEFGHPEWMDFPREGNNWSYDKCRRRFDLADSDHLRYKFMEAFDQAMQALDDEYNFLASDWQLVSSAHEEDKVIVFERGPLVFVFNFHPTRDHRDYKVGCDMPGRYRVALDSDAYDFGGQGRVAHDEDHFTQPEGVPGVAETNFNNRPNSFNVFAPSRTCQAYYRVPEAISPAQTREEQEEGGESGWQVGEDRAEGDEDNDFTYSEDIRRQRDAAFYADEHEGWGRVP